MLSLYSAGLYREPLRVVEAIENLINELTGEESAGPVRLGWTAAAAQAPRRAPPARPHDGKWPASVARAAWRIEKGDIARTIGARELMTAAHNSSVDYVSRNVALSTSVRNCHTRPRACRTS